MYIVPVAKQTSSERGYTFIDLAMSLAILGLLLSGITAGVRIYMKDKQMEQTREYARVAARAIDNYVLEKGRLPCPAPINAQIEDATYGTEVANCHTLDAGGTFDSTAGLWIEETDDHADKHVVRGMVPFATLNLPEFYAYDSYGNRLMYAVVSGKTAEDTFLEDNGGITVMDSTKSAGAAGDNRRRNHYLVFSSGVDGNGAWSRYGVEVRACNTVALDGENCNTLGGNATDKKARYVLARYSTATDNNRYDDVMVNRTTMHMPLWKPVSDGAGDNIRTVDSDMLSRIAGSGGGAFTAPSGVGALKLDVGGDALTHKVQAVDYCLHGDGARCFSPKDLLGDGARSDQLKCAPGEVPERLSDTTLRCRSFATFTKLCGVDEYMSGLKPDGDPECKSYVYNRGEPPKLVVGSCGSAHQSKRATQPSSNLCASGAAGAVSGSGNPWNWSCQGSGGGQTVTCAAWYYEPLQDASCGSVNGQSLVSEPGSSQKCGAGTLKNLANTTYQWNWRCLGLHGGSNSDDCYTKQMVHGACGASNGTNRSSAPSTGLCNAGNATSVTYGSNKWNWSCQGINSGTTASCVSYEIVNGACGTAHGVTVASPPSSGLCAAGNASSVGGANPYTWSCNGLNSGSSISCSSGAPTTVNGVCSSTAGACSTGSVTGDNGQTACGTTRTWSCAGGGIPVGTTASCSKANAACVPVVDGACGASAGSCSAGSASGDNNHTACGTTRTWSCTGSGGGTTASCSVSNGACVPVVNGACSSTAGACSAGTASGDNNQTACGTTRTWSCTGSGGGTTASCSKANAACVVNGSCGSSNNTCNAGSASGYNAGSCGGSATWSCNGSGGGTNASCSKANAACVVNGSCGSSNNTCNAGSASGYNAGSCGGSATWSCNGSGGGTNASCSKANAACAVNGSCGASNNTCNAGTAAGYNAGSCGGSATWSCNGSGGGSNASCSKANAACAVNGVCGSANGGIYASAPSSGLCSSGSASAVTTAGPFQPWSWSCNGANGGSSASCSADKDLFLPGGTMCEGRNLGSPWHIATWLGPCSQPKPAGDLGLNSYCCSGTGCTMTCE